jgi:hypothetical protein
MPDYQNGKIYKIVCLDTDETYYGSTVQDLRKRKSVHKDRAKYPEQACESRSIINRGNWKMELVENYPCSSKQELFARELFYIQNKQCVNKKMPWSTDEERKKAKSMYDKKYREGAKREEILEKKRQYSKDHAEEIKEKQKEYREGQKREEILQKKKEYYEKNRTQIRAKWSEKFECECGGCYTLNHKQEHFKSKKHQEYITRN